jgi:tRNA(Ile)-lysidine synthase
VSTAEDLPVSDAEADVLFRDLVDEPALVLAVSGGPDSTALLLLTARWRKRRNGGPRLLAVTVDHGLRPESRKEAAAVHRLARGLDVRHRTVCWRGPKPATGLQQKARAARYRMLAAAARSAKAGCILTAHTLDDQAETVMLRLLRGSGPSGLAGMARTAPLAPEFQDAGAKRATRLKLVRPLLDLPKARLIATLRAANVDFAEDASNVDPRFMRVRVRQLMPLLAREGLDARRVALLAARIRRADDAVEAAATAAWERYRQDAATSGLAMDSAAYLALPHEIALRLLGRAITGCGNEGPVELGKLESLEGALRAAILCQLRFRRTLAGAVVALARGRLVVAQAPPRKSLKLSRNHSAAGRTPAKTCSPSNAK